ncbi:MAG: hypothetical protein ILP10_04615 [Lachnospiraceae bacterium]|nr:hypothetical protein [Lachnospiraceae bacterium]
MGLFAFMYMLIGYLTGFSFKIYDPEDYTLPLFLVIAAEFVYNLLYYIFFFLLNGKLNIGYYIFRFAMPRVIYTVLISILLYKLINFLNVWQNNRRQPET